MKNLTSKIKKTERTKTSRKNLTVSINWIRKKKKKERKENKRNI